MDLQDKVIAITGAGRGIGEATAILAADHGAKVVVADIRTDWGQDAVDTIEKRGGEAVFFEVNVNNEDEVKEMVAFAVTTYGRFDGIVNNAATIVVKKAAEITAEEWDRVIRTNLTGVFYGCKHAIRRFEEQGSGGSIVNIGSISAVVGLPEQAVYCASKGGVFQLTRQIAIDYAADGIRCNTVGPGSVKGDFLDVYLQGQKNPAEAEQNVLDAHPIGRLASPFEVAETVIFLLSDRSSFVTGANLQVDGGYSAI